jgi:O-antigen chain-terminating methyltransferase
VFALDTFEISDEEINVEEIMQKIREKIKKWNDRGVYPDSDLRQCILPPAEQTNLIGIHDQVLDLKKNDMLIWPVEIRQDMDYINSNWEIQNNSYFISSHRPVTGKFLIKGREMVNGEIKRYVDPMIWKQNEFNGSVVRTLNETVKRISEISQFVVSACASIVVVNETTRSISDLSQRMTEFENITIEEIRAEVEGKIDEQLPQIEMEIRGSVDEKIGLAKAEISSTVDEKIGLTKAEISSTVDEKIGLTKAEISSTVDEKIGLTKAEISSTVDGKVGLARAEIGKEITLQVKSIVSVMNQEIENRAWLANILDKKISNYQNIDSSLPTQELGGDYFHFEERFRGSREDIKQRQTDFVHYFKECKNVLDIGCGRGEFLELLRENGINGHGIDIDEDMVGFCKSKGLDVKRIDAISYLEKIEDKSLDGIFLDQVVEHLEPDYLIRMLRLCHDKLNLGYQILIETVNPLSLVSFANFYLDLSHKRPIHPETLKFLMDSANFKEIATKFISPIPDEMRLKKIDVFEDEGIKRQQIDIYNYNIDMLNNILYGAQDYIVIAKR